MSAGQRFVEFGTPPKWHAKVFVRPERVSELVARNGNREVYTSAFLYPKPEPPRSDTPVVGDLYFDLDDESDLMKAQDDAKIIVHALVDEYGIPHDQVRVYFTGKKGFRVIVPWECIGVEPRRDLPQVWKRVAESFHARGCASVDLQVYQNNRFLRVPNSIHGDTGLHMIPLTLDELDACTPQQIKAMAAKPRDIDHPLPVLCPRAKTLIDLRPSKPCDTSATQQAMEFDETRLRASCPAVDRIYRAVEAGESLTHFQRVFLSKVLCLFGQKGEDEVVRLVKASMGERFSERITRYQIAYSKEGKCPPGCEFARKEWGICANCGFEGTPLDRMKEEELKGDEVIAEAEWEGTKYEILSPEHAPTRIPCYHLSPELVLQPVFMPARSKLRTGKKREHEVVIEDVMPFLLFADGGKAGWIPIDQELAFHGKTYDLTSKPINLDTFMTPRAVSDAMKDRKVDPKDIWLRVKDYLKRYLEFDDESLYAVYASWLVGTHFYLAYPAYPYMHFYGPPNSGKSQALRAGSRLAFHGEFVKGSTSPPLYRKTEFTGCTVFLDEMETLFDPKVDPMLCQYLNGGYQKDGFVERCNDKDPNVIDRFRSYSPKALASINDFHRTLRSRAVQVLMKRSVRNVGKEQFDEALSREIRDDLYTLRLQEGTAIAKDAQCYAPPPDLNLSNRDYELFRPLLHLAERFAHEDMDAIRTFIREYIKAKRDEDTEDIEAEAIYALLGMISGDENEQRVMVHDIRTKIIERDPEAYKIVTRGSNDERDWSKELNYKCDTVRKFTSARIGYAMKSLGFRKKRMNNGCAYYLTRPQVEDMAIRLGLGWRGIDKAFVLFSDERK